MLSPAELFAAFRQEYFGPITHYTPWRDGYRADAACLAALSPGQQAQAAAELLRALQARRADARALIGLGYLRCEAVLPLLHAYLQRHDFE